RLVGLDRRIRHQVHGRAHDARAVAGQHHGTVHLAQFAQAGGGELDVEREPAAGADRLDDLVVPEHDQGTGAAAQDAFEAVAQGGAGRHECQRGPHGVAGAHRAGPHASTAGGGPVGFALDRHGAQSTDLGRVGAVAPHGTARRVSRRSDRGTRAAGSERLTGADRIEWRRAFPGRALKVVGVCAAAGGLAVVAAWVLFGDDPARLNSGEANPLASVPQWTIVAAAAVVGASCVPVFRRPSVVATPYALSVRPGVLRRLLLPWATIAEITGVRAAGEEFLLVRLQRGLTR